MISAVFVLFLLLFATVNVNSVAIPKVDNSEPLFTDTFENDIEKSQGQTNEIEIPNEQNVCKSDICLKESTRILNSLDPDVDPCENFYQFACGKYMRNTVLSEDKYRETSFSLAQDAVDKQLESIFFEEIQPDETKSSKLAKEFTKLCMDVDTLNRNGITPMLDILEKYGGWPVVKGDLWNTENWQWTEINKQIASDGLPSDFILSVSVGADFQNTTNNIIMINRAGTGLKRDLLLKGRNDTNVKAYLDFMIDVAVIFGANRSRAEDELSNVLQFECDLANIEFGDFYLKISIEELQANNSNINWLDFVNVNLNNIHRVNENETVVLIDGSFIHELDDVIQKTPNRTIANYIAWRLVLFGSDLLSEEVYQRYQQFIATSRGALKLKPRSTECSAQTIKELPIAAAAIYARKFFNKESRQIAVGVAKMIHEEFVQTLQNVTWMNETSRTAAISKANAMQFHIGYPDELVDDKKLDEHYSTLKLQSDSLLYSAIRIRKFNKDLEVNQMRKAVNKTDWIEHSLRTTKVDAFYSILENSIQFPASILQDQFFSANRPFYMNFGTIGFFFGHEITHGFDDTGREFDSNANMVDWWDENTMSEFNTKSRCFIEQYSNYSDAVSNITVDGEKTNDENIADNGGIKVAYAAYQKYIQRNGADPILPNLDYSANQLFWISGAQLWCSVSRPEFDKTQNAINEHTPFNYRIIGSFSNSKNFAKDFKCSLGSVMNPVNKCEIW